MEVKISRDDGCGRENAGATDCLKPDEIVSTSIIGVQETRQRVGKDSIVFQKQSRRIPTVQHTLPRFFMAQCAGKLSFSQKKARLTVAVFPNIYRRQLCRRNRFDPLGREAKPLKLTLHKRLPVKPAFQIDIIYREHQALSSTNEMLSTVAKDTQAAYGTKSQDESLSTRQFTRM